MKDDGSYSRSRYSSNAIIGDEPCIKVQSCVVFLVIRGLHLLDIRNSGRFNEIQHEWHDVTVSAWPQICYGNF